MRGKIIRFLLENAGVSIRYRVKREILHIPPDTAEMRELQAQILQLPKIKKAFVCQRESGFIGNVLHGAYFDGFDSTVELLKRLGVAADDPHLIRARDALTHWQNYSEDHFYKAGNAMDEYGRGGFRAVWADQLIELGADESLPLIQEQIGNALHAFRGALLHTSVDDFTKKMQYKGKPCRCYIKGAAFPAANHVSILEKTLSWRSAENLAMVQKSYRHCQELMKNYHDGFISIHCGYFLGPFNYNWTAQIPRNISVRDFDAHPIDFAWFMKGLSSASICYPVFDNTNPLLDASLTEWLSDPAFVESVSAQQLRMFKNYASVEPSWRKKESIACDLYFPLVLALHRENR